MKESTSGHADEHDAETAAIALSLSAGQARMALEESLRLLRNLASSERIAVLSDGPLTDLFHLIAPQRIADTREGELVYEYLLRNKEGLALISQVRRFITDAYCCEGTVNGHQVFIAADQNQWFAEGVMFLQGTERFAGFPGLYTDGRLKFAVAARDTRAGDQIGPNDLTYLDLEDYQRTAVERPQPTQADLSEAPATLSKLLAERVGEEKQYQDYLTRYPWVLGAQYSSIQSHARFDDRNIPDFSGVRLRDETRDIIEIKSPFLSLFRADGEFSADFYAAWGQVERYLDFARRDPDYLLRQRGLRFDNPHAVLIAGYQLSEAQLAGIRSKERMNPAITFWSFDELLRLTQGTAALIRELNTAIHNTDP
jgi:hypothetical protein